VHCKLVACGVHAGELSGAADGRSRSSCEEGGSKVPSGGLMSTGQINISGVINIECRFNHVRGVIVAGTQLIDLRPGIGIKAQKLTRLRRCTASLRLKARSRPLRLFPGLE
jgi:hypothetical protein